MDKHFNGNSNNAESPAGSPYNVANAIKLMHEGVVVPKQAHVVIAKRGDDDDGKMSITSVKATNNDEDAEECEEDDDEDEDAEECDEEEDDDEEDCEDDDDEDEECDAEGDDEEDCEGDDGTTSPIGNVVDFSTVPTPSNL